MRIFVLALLLVACSKSAEKSAPPADPVKPNDTGGGPGNVKGGPRTAIDFGDDEFTAVGDIDKNTVKSTVKSNLVKLQTCYDRALLANPGIEGKVLATFKVAIDGTVREAKASGVHPDVESCVTDVIKTLRFPTGTTEVAVSYPFTFRN